MNLLEEARIYFIERALKSEGLCKFSIPTDAIDAVFDEHTFIFQLPGGKDQMCLRVCFDTGVETIRRRFEFPVWSLDIMQEPFLRMAQYAAQVFSVSEKYIELDDIYREELFDFRKAWMMATEDLEVPINFGFTRRPTVNALKCGWEREMNYIVANLII